MRSDPDIYLPETLLQRLLELLEKRPVLGQVGHVHIESRQVIAISFALVFLNSSHYLGLPRRCAELGLEFDEGLRQQRLGDGAAVVKQQRHQNLVPA